MEASAPLIGLPDIAPTIRGSMSPSSIARGASSRWWRRGGAGMYVMGLPFHAPAQVIFHRRGREDAADLAAH